MDQTSNEYGKLIDQLRKDRKMTRADLVQDIMSLRSYQRFISGEVQLSNSKLNSLIDRLGLEHMNVKHYFAIMQEQSLVKFVDAHNAMMKLDYKLANVKLAVIDKDKLKTKIDIQEYNYIDTTIKYELNEITRQEAFNSYCSIVNYPTILEYNIINIVEFNILIKLNNIITLKGDNRILIFLEKILDNEKNTLISLDDDKSLVIYSVLAKGYYFLNDFEKTLEVCNNGIEYSKTTFGKFGMVNLYAYKASALAKMYRFDESKDAMILTYMSLLIEGNEKKTKIYVDHFEKTFNINIKNLLKIEK